MLTKNIEQLQKTIQVCKIHLNRLNDAYRNSIGIIPVSEKSYLTLSDIETAFIDQFILRFAKLQDMMGEKLFRQLLLFVEEPVDTFTFRDILNKIEKFGIINDHEIWAVLREARNDVSHEYPVITTEAVTSLNELFQLKDELEKIFHSCLNFLKSKDEQNILGFTI